MTNLEKITKSPEALAKFIYNAVDSVCSHEQCFVANNCHGKGCIECIADWLKQEVKEDEYLLENIDRGNTDDSKV